jgi:pilus assembly protein CpaC
MQQPIALRQNSGRPNPPVRVLAGRRSRLLFGCLAAVGTIVADGPATAQNRSRPVRIEEPVSSNEPTFVVNTKSSRMQMVERFSKVLELEPRIARVDGFDPSVINVTALAPNRLRVQAISPGVTTMVIVDEAGEVYSIEVFVNGDVRHLQAYIERMFPQSAVQAVKVQDSVVLRGWVTQPEHITHIVEIAEQFFPRVLNQMQVGGLQQVALKVKVMEVQRSKVRQLGFNFLHVTDDAFLVSTPGQLVQLAEIISPFGGPPGVSFAQSTLRDSTLVGGVVSENSIFQGFLEALKREGLLKILAEPELVTTNGRPAHLLSGGEFPVLVPQSLGTVTIEWREFGVRLEAVPNILGRGRVRLELEPEVSERDFSQAVTVNGITVPGLTTRRANTQVEMKFGETFVIAGLLSMRKTAETAKVPLLGELPWIGAAFRRVAYDEAETELVIMVTPELVAPLAADQIPCGGPGLFSTTPTDRELYIDGFLEVPNYGDECINCAPGTMGTGPCGPEGCPPGLNGAGPIPAGPVVVPGAPLPGTAPLGLPPAALPYDATPAEPPPAPEPALSSETSLWGSAAPRAAETGASGPRNPFGPGTDQFQPSELEGPSTSAPAATGTSGPATTTNSRPGLIEPRPGLIEPQTGWQPTRERHGLIAPSVR